MNAPRNTTRDNAPRATILFCRQLETVIPSLRSFARRLCSNPEMADDLVQETMMRALIYCESFKPGTNFQAWTYTILRNQFYTKIRKESWMTSWDPEAADRILAQDPAQQDAIHLVDLEKAMLQLPFEQREMLLLVGADGATYQEAAQIVGCSLGTVKSRVARGRIKLASIINGPNEDKKPGLAVDTTITSCAA